MLHAVLEQRLQQAVAAVLPDAETSTLLVRPCPDPKFGEELVAWIRLKEGQTATAEEIRDFCRNKISHYKIPRYIKFVTEFPMTVTGKIQKYKMREAATAELRV